MWCTDWKVAKLQENTYTLHIKQPVVFKSTSHILVLQEVKIYLMLMFFLRSDTFIVQQ